jgi:signal transduction histidine kinase/DNA-binding NarL/FixJ family response regulator
VNLSIEVSNASHYLLVDDHSLIREGMMQAIRGLAPDARFAHANSLQSALARLAEAIVAHDPFDVILLDLGLPDSRGVATLQAMRAAAPTQRIGIITGQCDVQVALECIHHGASCFIPKLAEIDGFMTAMRALVEGRLHFPSELLAPSDVAWPELDDATASTPRDVRLTPRQRDVLQWILKGCTNHAIATALGISAETVKLHVSAIFRAYGVHSRTQLVLLCSRTPPLATEGAASAPPCLGLRGLGHGAFGGRQRRAPAGRAAGAACFHPRQPAGKRSVSLWRRSLRGLTPIEARIDLQLLQDSWRTSPGSIVGQCLALLALCWIVRKWPIPPWQWWLPASGLVLTWIVVVLMARHFRRFGITASGYERWRVSLLWWHGAQSTMWGLLALALLGVAVSTEWKVTLVAAVIVYAYTIGLVTVQDWAVAFLGSMPLVALAVVRLLLEGTPHSAYLAIVLVLSMITCVIISQGISRRLREGALLRHENADLVLQLRDEIQKVTQAKARAETADRQKGEFFAAASHDLRQPLHVMMLLNSALKPHVGTVEGQGVLDKMQTTLGSLSTMFDKMFDVARLDAQRVVYRAHPVSLATLWARLDSEFSALCDSQGLRWTLCPTTDWVQADPHVLERMLRNLLNNAVRYTEHGEVRLRARVRGPFVVCQVWDTGVGIPRAHRQRIFEDYYQANNAARRSDEGLGLGLAVVRRLSMLGPTPVTVLSRPGRGSCFSVRLPRLPANGVFATLASQASDHGPVHRAPATATATPSGKATAVPAPPRVVMLIEDDPDVRDSTALVLQQHGWMPVAASTPDGALDVLCQWQTEGLLPEGTMPAALISDQRLGLSVNGLDAIRNLRYEFGDDLPAFLLTAEATPGLATQAREARVHLLHKPLQADRLLRLLDEARTQTA